MTERLYYNDPYLREFDATVTRADVRGGRVAVTLDRTAFYPTTGGQPFDTGLLGGDRVVDVVEDDEGEIVHIVEAEGTSKARPGEHVRAAIDWPRRFDHMQQHTGQHVLSAAIEHLLHVRTVSFHLGTDSSTIDLAREMTQSDIAAAEDLANQIVWEDRPVGIRYATAEEAARMPLRKESVREGTLRLIDIDRFDLSACGGTHVARTGAIGLIGVVSWERFKGGQRIEFLCGGRALTRLRALRDTTTSAVRLLSVLPHELPDTIERMQTDAKEQKRAIAALQIELAAFRAAEIADEAEEVRLKPDATSVKAVFRAIDADANALKALASAIAARPGHVIVLASTARPALVVVARSADVPVAANAVLSVLAKAFGGRGGGRPELAQGGGLDAPAETILAAARDVIAGSPHQ